jgi:hypothetical protein
MSIFVRLSGFMKVALPRRLSDLQLHLSLAGREEEEPSIFLEFSNDPKRSGAISNENGIRPGNAIVGDHLKSQRRMAG